MQEIFSIPFHSFLKTSTIMFKVPWSPSKVSVSFPFQPWSIGMSIGSNLTYGAVSLVWYNVCQNTCWMKNGPVCLLILQLLRFAHKGKFQTAIKLQAIDLDLFLLTVDLLFLGSLFFLTLEFLATLLNPWPIFFSAKCSWESLCGLSSLTPKTLVYQKK